MILHIYHRAPNGENVCLPALWPSRMNLDLEPFMERYCRALGENHGDGRGFGWLEGIADFLGYVPMPYAAVLYVGPEVAARWENPRLKPQPCPCPEAA